MKKLMMVMAAALLTLGASAETETDANGVTWSYTVTDGKATVYKGSASPAIPTTTTGSITIPSTLGGRPVTAVGRCAFYNCSGLTSVTIPEGVTSIGDSAFYDCGRIASVTIPGSVTSIGRDAFRGCSGLKSVMILDISAWCRISFSGSSSNPMSYAQKLYLKGVEVTDVVIPADLTILGNYVFYGCSGLRSVMFPKGVTSIMEYAFYNCSGLTSVTFPEGVKTIGDSAFCGCCGLTSLTIPEGVTSIGRYAFSGCSGLASVMIPGSVASISDWAFCHCSGLTTVTIPAGVTSIGSGAFQSCSGLMSLTIPPSVTSIGGSVFSGCSGLESVVISDLSAWCRITFAGDTSNPMSCAQKLCLNGDELTDVVLPADVTTIKDYAFDGCSGLKSVTIPEGVTSIGRNAFSGCSGLESVMIPEGVTRVGYYAFSGCSGLRSVTIPSSVTSIGHEAFYNCSRLTSVVISDLSAWCRISFSGGSSSNPLYYAHKLILNDVELTDLVIPADVTSIEGYAFYGCSGLKSVTIPECVTSIEYYAFSDCSGIKSVDFLGAPPSGVSGSSLLSYGVVKYSREYGAEWQKIIDLNSFRGYLQDRQPVVEIVSAAIRGNDSTVMDVVYRVKSAKPTVKVRALAFQDGVRSFANVIKVTDLIEGTAANVGDAIAANEEHKLSWRISSDWAIDLAKVKFEVLASEGDLLQLELTTIPKIGDHASMEISWNAMTEQQVFDALLWMYADGDEGLVLTDGVLKRASDGYLLGYGTTVSIWNGRYSKNVTGNGSAYYYFAPAIDYVYSKMGFSVLSGDELKYANEMTRLGLSPSGVRQYAWREVND